MKIFRLLVLVLILLITFSIPSRAAEKITVGSACTGDANATDWDTIFQCVGNLWKRAPIQLGSSSDSCDATHKGLIQWTGTGFQACTNGTSWEVLGSGSTGLLGASATATDPQRSGDAGTGLFSNTASSVSIATGGVQRLVVTGTGNVGIGTAAPAYPLHVETANGAGETRPMLRLVAGQTGRNPTLKFDSINTQTGTKAYVVQTDADDGVFPHLNLNPYGGNVGIATSTPAYKLDVNGSLNATALYVNGSAVGGGSSSGLVGMIAAFYKSPLPTGWVECNGQTVASATYPDLVLYLSGSATATSATVPDLRGYFLRGVNTSATGVDPSRTLASIQTSALGAHTHTGSTSTVNASAATTSSDGAHTHSYSRPSGDTAYSNYTGLQEYSARYSGTGSTSIVSAGAHTHTVTIPAHSHTFTTDSTGTTETRPSNIAVIYAIRAQ